MLLLLAGWRKAGKRWGRLDRRAVGQPGDCLTKGQIGIEPGRAPALGVSLRLPDVGGAHFLGLPHLLAFHPQAHPGAAVECDVSRLAPVVPERPTLTGLDPARGNAGGAEAVGGIHGRKDTAGRLNRCDSLNGRA